MYPRGLRLTALPAFKYAAVRRDGADDEESSVGRNLAVGAAAALPFAGLIRRPAGANHQDRGQLYEDWAAFQKTLQPGDVLLTGDNDLTANRVSISIPTGTPTGKHVSVVGMDNDVHHFIPQQGYSTTRLGLLAPYMQDGAERFTHVQVLRPKMTPEQRDAFINNLREQGRFQDDVRFNVRRKLEALLASDTPVAAELRKLSRPQLEERVDTLVNLYSKQKGISAGAHELFVPKLRDMHAGTLAAHSDVTRGAPGATVEETGDRIVAGFKSLTARPGWHEQPFTGDELVHCMPYARTGVCSSNVAKAFNTALNAGLVTDKLPDNVLPHDFLRSNALTPVSRFTRTNAPPPAIDRVLRAAPMLTRAAAGVGLAGGVYGLSRYLDSRNETERR